MADETFLKILEKGVDAWNEWRRINYLSCPDLRRANLVRMQLPGIVFTNVDLTEADLQYTNLKGADLSYAQLDNADLCPTNLIGANLEHAHLIGANLFSANLSRANLQFAKLRGANLWMAQLNSADLRNADLEEANLRGTYLNDANLSEANLSHSHMIGTKFNNANLRGCSVYGVSAWDIELERAIQTDLVISGVGASLTADNLEVAQFLYVLLNNRKLREAIDSITLKVVLILGRFTPKRKMVLEAIREALRRHNYLPVLFDFEKPNSRDTMETVSTIAHMARFVIADLTEARSVLQELQHIIPRLPSVPVQPLLESSDNEPGMLDHLRNYRSLLKLHKYETVEDLMKTLDHEVIAPSEMKAKEFTNS